MNTMELTIKDKVYQFKFGIGFVKEINKTKKRPVDGMPGVEEEIGLAMAVAEVIDGNILALAEVLDLANKGKSPRVTRTDLEDYLDDENTDIDKLFDDVIDFFGKANATKKVTKKMLAAMEDAEQ